MGDTYTSFHKLFFDEMIKTWMNSHIKVLDRLSKFIEWNKENKRMDQLYIARERGGILSYVDLSKLCHVIKYFSSLNQSIGKE